MVMHWTNVGSVWRHSRTDTATAGHLRCLSATDLYRYLSQEHEATTVGLLVGMGAARAGTMDSTVAKMLFLHIPARHPAGYPDLDVAPTVQAAALLGAGLLYRGTCHRCRCGICMRYRSPQGASTHSSSNLSLIRMISDGSLPT